MSGVMLPGSASYTGSAYIITCIMPNPLRTGATRLLSLGALGRFLLAHIVGMRTITDLSDCGENLA